MPQFFAIWQTGALSELKTIFAPRFSSSSSIALQISSSKRNK
jgi:hypothetical protein